MAFTGQQIVDEARSLLQDQVTPYRYTDPQLLQAINISLYEIRRIRPDAFAGNFITGLTPLAALGDPVPVDDIFFPPMIDFVTGYAELRDDEFVDGAADATGGRAVALLERFAAKLNTSRV